jgi:ribonuclease P protein component
LAKPFSFGKKERLKSRKAIEALFVDGKKFALPPLRVIYRFIQVDPSPVEKGLIKVGVSASSRNFKKAVTRNRIKRLLRESYRLQKTGLQQQLLKNHRQLELFIIYTGKDIPVYQELFDKMTAIIKRLETQVNEDIS